MALIRMVWSRCIPAVAVLIRRIGTRRIVLVLWLMSCCTIWVCRMSMLIMRLCSGLPRVRGFVVVLSSSWGVVVRGVLWVPLLFLIR